jgi:ferritin-like metal-binding protein YciE
LPSNGERGLGYSVPQAKNGASEVEELARRGNVSVQDEVAVILSEEVAVGLFSKEIKSMEDLFLHVMQDIYYTEQQILKALPKMIEKATNRELSAAFRSHLEETKGQVERLEQAFELLGEKPKATSCPSIDGIIKEADEIAGEVADKKVLDAALLAAAQAVEHYEITRYGTLIAWADELENDAVAKLLTTTLNQEKAADKKLTAIAEGKVNLKAAG